MSNLNIKIFIIGFIFLIGFSSSAKSNTIEDVITKINTIENRIKVLEKATFNKTNSSQSNFNAGNYDSIITKQSIQISELQNQIQELSNIRQSVAFSGNAGKDPINEFKKGAFNSFNNLIYKIQEDIVLISNNLKFRIGPTEEKKTDQNLIEKKIGRNDPCPCGSGKKYKQCHGK